MIKNKRVITPDGGAELHIIGDLQAEIDALKNTSPGDSDQVFVTIPEFIEVVSQRADRLGVYPTLKFALPQGTTKLRCYVAKKADWDAVDADTNNKVLKSATWEDEITDQSVDASTGYFVGEFSRPLAFDTDYYIVRLTAFKDGSKFATNPEGDALSGDGSAGSGSHLAEFHTKQVFPAIPPFPTAGDILKNSPYLDDGINGNAEVDFRLWVTADHTGYLEDEDIERGYVRLIPYRKSGGSYIIDADSIAITPHTDVDYPVAIELDSGNAKHKAMKVITFLPLGQKYRWYGSSFVNPAGKGKSDIVWADPPTNTIPDGVDFWAGGKAAESDSEIPEPIVVVDGQIDARHTEVHLSFTQGATPVLLAKYRIYISYDGGTTWKSVAFEYVRGVENVDLTGAITTEKVTIKHQKNFTQATWKLKAKLVGVGRVGVDNHAPFKETTAPNYTNFTPFYGKPDGNVDAPVGGDITSVINTDTEAADALVTVTFHCREIDGSGNPTGVAKSWRDAHIIHVYAVLYADSGGVTEKFKIGGAITDETATTAVFKDVVPLGEDFYWKKNIVNNGDGKRESVAGTAVHFVSGGIARAANNSDVPVPSFQAITQIDNKHTDVTIRFTQPTPAIFLKKCVVEISFDNGTSWRGVEGGGFNIKNDETYHVAGTTYDTKLLLKHPANQSQLKFRVKIVAVGNFVSSWVNSGTQTTASEATVDTAAPTGLNTPVLAWNSASKLMIRNLTFASDSTTNNYRTLKEKYIVVKDTVSGNYYDFATNAVAASESAARFKVGLVSELTLSHAKKRKLLAAFGSGFNLVAYWYAENDVNISAASSNSAGVSESSIFDYLASGDAVNVIDVGAGMVTKQQLLLNGDFLYNNGTSTKVNGWVRYTSTPATPSDITTTTSDDVFWDKDNHSLTYRNQASAFNSPLKKRLTKGSYFALTFLAKTAGSFGSGTLEINIVNSDDSSASGSVVTINLADLTSSFQLFGVLLQTDTSSDFTANKFLKFQANGTLSGTNNIIFDKMMLVRGKDPGAFAPRTASFEGDGTNPAATEDFSLTTINNVSQPDVYSPTGGAQGGWTGIGGIKVVPDTL